MTNKPSIDARKVLRELGELHRAAPRLGDEMLGQWAENLTSEMKQEGVVPRDTGRLRDSHGWEKVRALVYRVFANTTYAAAVHERHPTQSGWFQKTLAARALETLKKVVEAMRDKLKP
ncbi:MAG: HK97 gp10 family phage protein [Phycisphaerales bacterium]